MKCELRLVLTLVAVTMVAAGCTRHGDHAFSTTSPKGTYHLKVLGNLEPPRSMFVEHLVEADVSRSSGEALVRAYLYSGDSFDDGFRAKFMTPVWTAENILRFPARAPNNSLKDTVVVQNRSGRVLRCLRVETSDVFLVFDVVHGADVELVLSDGQGELHSLSLMIWFHQGKPSIDEVRTFEISPGVRVPRRVTVTEDRIRWADEK